jgi:hypothetical protein
MRQPGCEAAAAATLWIALLGGCVPNVPNAPAPEPSPPRGRAGAAPVSTELQSKVQAALTDAARRTGLDTSALKVISAEQVIWPDGSLGCPAPGMMYSMALVPGHRIRIQAGTQQLDYHSALNGQPTLCPQGRATNPVADDRPV